MALKIDQIKDLQDNSIINKSGSNITLGASNDTIAFASGVTNNLLTPAFEAKLSSAQSISDDTFVKVQFDSEVYDTNNAYDNATNYRFTVPTGFAGKYSVYCTLQLAGDGGNLDILDTGLRIYKNGSSVLWNAFGADDTSTADRNVNIAISTVLDLSESDYLEIYGLVNSVSGTQSITGDSGVQKRSYFGAYRIGA